MFVDSRLTAITEQLEQEADEVQGAFLSYFLATSQLSRRELNASVVEILLGGVDTVRRHKLLKPPNLHCLKSNSIEKRLFMTNQIDLVLKREMVTITGLQY